jgi:hypothetical protein
MEAMKQAVDFLDTLPGMAAIVAGIIILLAAIRLVLQRSAIRKNTGLLMMLAGLLLFCLVFLLLSFGFPSKGQVSASVVPRLWIFGLVACCIYLFISTLRGNEEPDPAVGHLSLVFLFIGLSIVYMILIEVIGFYISSFLFLAAGMLVLAYRRWAVLLTVAGGWVVFSYLVFNRILFVPLPDGALIELLTR